MVLTPGGGNQRWLAGKSFIYLFEFRWFPQRNKLPLGIFQPWTWLPKTFGVAIAWENSGGISLTLLGPESIQLPRWSAKGGRGFNKVRSIFCIPKQIESHVCYLLSYWYPFLSHEPTTWLTTRTHTHAYIYIYTYIYIYIYTYKYTYIYIHTCNI